MADKSNIECFDDCKVDGNVVALVTTVSKQMGCTGGDFDKTFEYLFRTTKEWTWSDGTSDPLDSMKRLNGYWYYGQSNFKGNFDSRDDNPTCFKNASEENLRKLLGVNSVGEDVGGIDNQSFYITLATGNRAPQPI
jgi:hypothetical protein